MFYTTQAVVQELEANHKILDLLVAKMNERIASANKKRKTLEAVTLKLALRLSIVSLLVNFVLFFFISFGVIFTLGISLGVIWWGRFLICEKFPIRGEMDKGFFLCCKKFHLVGEYSVVPSELLYSEISEKVSDDSSDNEVRKYYATVAGLNIQLFSELRDRLAVSRRTCPKCGKSLIADGIYFELKRYEDEDKIVNVLFTYNCIGCHYQFRESMHDGVKGVNIGPAV